MLNARAFRSDQANEMIAGAIVGQGHECLGVGLEGKIAQHAAASRLFGIAHEWYSLPMEQSRTEADQRRDELLRRALATPPISNEEIIRRSKQVSRKRRA